MTERKLIFPTTVFALFCVLWIKAIYPAASGIADTDFFWHLAYGKWIVSNAAIPAVDSFSWSMSGTPYQLTQWLGEATIGLVYSWAGLDGTKALAVFLAGITICFSWLAARRYVHTSVAMGLAIAGNLIQIVTPMRPQLFSFALLSIGMFLISGWLETGRRRYLYAYALMMIAWVNLHGGFVVGLITIGMLAVGQTIETILAKRWDVDRRAILFVWVMVAVSALASMINPYGYRALTAVIIIGGLESSKVISEWQPVNITTEVGWFYLINLIPFMGLLLITPTRPRVTYGLMAGFFLFFGILANRQVAMCAAVMAPITASVLGRTSIYERMRDGFLNPSKPVLYLSLSLVMLGAAPWIIARGDASVERSFNLQYPQKATDFLVANGLDRRVLSDTLEASYLIYRGVPVFIDGRMDLYRDRFFFEWYLADRAAPGWEALIEKHQPEAMLLRVDMALRQAALAGGRWKQVYQDERYSILVPSSNDLPELSPKPVEYLSPEGRLKGRYMP